MNVMLVLRSGGDFKKSDVLLLARHINERLNGVPVHVYCIADIVDTITIDFKNGLTWLPMKHKWQGWWSKMNLYSPEMEFYRPFLYIDLDTAVLCPISEIMPNEDQISGFIMLRDFYQLSKPASGLLWIPAKNEKINKVWDTWIQSPMQFITRLRGDQDFISTVVQPDSFWQDITHGIVTFKPNKKRRVILNGSEKIVCFHGKPRIPEAAKDIDWVYEYCYE